VEEFRPGGRDADEFGKEDIEAETRDHHRDDAANRGPF
jgi:hypothetical protein